MTTRLFTDADLAVIYAIEEACFAPSLRFSRLLMSSLVISEDCRTWVGLADGTLCGFAIVALLDDEDPEAAYIWTIEVLSEYRRMGVAGRLLERVEGSARAAGLRKVGLHVSERNDAARELYEKCGYLRMATAAHFYGRNQNGLRYEKLLPGI